VAARPLWVRTLIDSLHALSAGATPGAAAALWVVRSGAQPVLDPAVFPNVVDTWTPVLWVPVISVVLLVITGLVRLPHRTTHVEPEARRPRARATLIKHASFVAILIGSSAFMISLMQY
jgi:hypothetical protein